MSWVWLSGTGIQYWPIKTVFLHYTFCLLSQLISFVFISHPVLLWAMLIRRWCKTQSECLYMGFAWAEKWYVSKYLEEIYLKSALAVSFFSFENLLSENGTSVREVPVHLKAGVWNLASWLLPAKAAASETLLLRWRVESWKRSLFRGLRIPRACVRVYARVFVHTCALGRSVHGSKGVYGKGWWQAGFGFSWRHEKLQQFFVWKQHYCWSVKKNLRIAPATLLALAEQQAASGPTFSDTQLGHAEALMDTGVQVACPLLCPQGQLWKPGCWRGNL